MTDIQRRTPAEIAQIEDAAEAGALYKSADAAAQFYEAQDRWQDAQAMKEISLRAVRQAGKIMLPPEEGGNTPREKAGRPKKNSSASLTNYQRTLEDAGITRDTASKWQKLARIPEEDFEAYFAEADYFQDEFTIAGLLRYAGEWYQSSKTSEWETPDWLFSLLEDEFRFTLDVCATPDNAKCERFFTAEQDGLSQPWEGVCWMNPPYGTAIPKWVKKAREEADAGAWVICLVPARTDTDWWWSYCIGSEIRFLKGRLKFGGGENSAPFPSAVVIMRPDDLPGVVWWREAQEGV